MSPERVKIAVRERDGQRCTLCGLTGDKHFKRFGRNLEVHRTEPGSRYTLAGCVTVCRPCHWTLPRSPRGSSGIWLCRLPPAHHAALKAMARANRRTIVTELRIVLNEYILAHGLTPPAW